MSPELESAWSWLHELSHLPCAEQSNHTMCLSALQPAMTYWARTLSDCPELVVLGTSHEGGYRGRLLYLPTSIRLGQSQHENLSFYLWRLLYLISQRQLGLNWQEPGHYTLEASRHRAQASAPQVLNQLFGLDARLEPLYQLLQTRVAQAAIFDVENWLPWGRWLAPLPVTQHLSAQAD